jgi:hypothetical protein
MQRVNARSQEDRLSACGCAHFALKITARKFCSTFSIYIPLVASQKHRYVSTVCTNSIFHCSSEPSLLSIALHISSHVVTQADSLDGVDGTLFAAGAASNKAYKSLDDRANKLLRIDLEHRFKKNLLRYRGRSSAKGYFPVSRSDA